MASMSSLGGGPEFSPCLTNIMNFIVISPLIKFDFDPGSDDSGRLNPGSIYATNEESRNRHGQRLFLRSLLLLDLLAQALLLLPQFGSKFGAEIFGFEDLTNLDLRTEGARGAPAQAGREAKGFVKKVVG